MSTISNLTADQKARLEILQQAVVDCQKAGIDITVRETPAVSAFPQSIFIVLPQFRVNAGAFEKVAANG